MSLYLPVLPNYTPVLEKHAIMYFIATKYIFTLLNDYMYDIIFLIHLSLIAGHVSLTIVRIQLSIFGNSILFGGQ